MRWLATALPQASLLAVEGYTVPLESEAASKLAGSERQQAAALQKCLRRLTPVFSIEASPIFMAGRNLLLLFFTSKSRFFVGRYPTSSE